MKNHNISSTKSQLKIGLLQFIFILLVCSFSNAQVQDDFSDGDFSNNPTWSGSAADFMINTNSQLQLNNTVAATSQLHTPHLLSNFDDKEWKFWVRQNFAGSGTNYGRIYLTTASTDLSTNPDGIYLQLGEANATDAIRLMQRSGGTTTTICSTTDGTIAAAFSTGIQIKRSATGNWILNVDFTGGTNYSASVNGNEITAPVGTNFGYLCVYTATNSTRFYLDNVYIGDEIVDTDAPAMTSITVVDASTLTLTYSEPITQLSAETLANYSITPTIAITSVVQNVAMPTSVQINLAAPLTNGSNYSLSTTAIEDLFSNTSNLQSLSFDYLIAETPTLGDIVITEFFPDPSPSVGLPEFEFVEIHNLSNKIFNLNGWKLGDNATFGTIQNAWILPGEYKILCPVANIASFPNSVGVVSFPSLNNTTDEVKIQDNTGFQLDFLSYTTDWYQDASKIDGGWTIERINTAFDCSNSSNWKASIDAMGGTPGVQNSVFDITPDQVPATITAINVLNANEINIQFNELVDAVSLTTTPIDINPNLTIANRTITGTLTQTMQISFVESLETGISYAITLSSITDCSSNSGSASGTFMIPGIPAVGDIIINEVMIDPTPVIGLPEVEFVEIYNKSNKTFNITGWKLGDNSSFGTIQSAWLAPGEYKVLCPSSAVSEFTNAVGVTSFPSLGNTSDDVVLQDNSGLELDKISYSTSWYQDMTKKDGGWTLELINPQAPCSQSTNWRASINVNGGTPGSQNSVYDLTPDTSAPFIIGTTVIGTNKIEIIANEPLTSTSILNSNFTITPTLLEANRIVSSTLNASFQIEFQDELTPSTIYNYTLDNINDCWGNSGTLIGSFVLESPASIGDIVLNEILFDPLAGGSDWVELFNQSNKVINLKNFSIGRLADGVVTDKKVITSNYFLMPNDYVVIGGDSSHVITNYPATIIGKFYQLSLASMPNDAGSVVISAPIITENDTIELVMDQVQYSDKWHYRLLDSKDGKSLERRDPKLPTQDAKNWYTAAENLGFATPGRVNSQYFPALFNGKVNLASETVSPDNDGFEDLLQINYEMEMAGMLATIQIFDDRGRSIKTIMSNELLGLSGTITWDGIREDGQKAAIGTYVLLMEAFNIEGGSEFVSKKAFVVAGKM